MISRILIIDDDHASSSMLVDMLDMAGLDADVAHTASMGIGALASGRYAAALLDLTLPDASPEELIASLLTLPQRPPLVVFSARIEEDVRRAAKALGAVTLRKPARMEAIVDAVRNAMGSGAFYINAAGETAAGKRTP